MDAAVSVDLEPNKDGGYDGVCDAMTWFDDIIPRGTVFATYRVATNRPGLLADLADDHEMGIHVHPKEFGHDRDRLAELPTERQRDLILRTRRAVADAIGVTSEAVDVFRAGRHSASVVTLEALDDLGFAIDASVHVRYRDHLPAEMTDYREPYPLSAIHALDGIDGLLEVPTTFARPSILSVAGLRARGIRGLLGLNRGVLTATANTLRTDRLCSGERAFAAAVDGADVVSTYMHPYDATDYHDLENAGREFRDRFERVLGAFDSFRTVSELAADTVNGDEVRV